MNHFITSEALKDDLVFFGFYVEYLAYKEALKKVKAKYPDHTLELTSFKRYAANINRDMVTDLSQKFTEAQTVEDLLKVVLTEEDEEDGGNNSEANGPSPVD
ncbi:hypothetical protein ACH5RR_013314 [Cinchona calisaya]|uniref:Phage protein n=1 Tax=Cinchona calisaya TaxID=153742 RepID=A0ABD3A3B5_9GENT